MSLTHDLTSPTIPSSPSNFASHIPVASKRNSATSLRAPTPDGLQGSPGHKPEPSRPPSRTSRRSMDDVNSLKRQLQELKAQLASSRVTIVQLEKSAKPSTSSGPPRRPNGSGNGTTSRPLSPPPTSIPSLPHSTPMFDLQRASSSNNTALSPPSPGLGDSTSSDGSRAGLGMGRVLSAMMEEDGSSPGSGRGLMDAEGKHGTSRIPTSHVSSSLALHASTLLPPHSPRSRPSSPSPLASPTSAPPSAYHSPAYPSSIPLSAGARKPSASGGGSSKVIEGLQREVEGLKGGLERCKGEVRAGQRVVATLTRQNDDLKETKERNRAEMESLNNVISRKERLLQEVLDRARTAESSLLLLQKDRKALETSTKKSLAAMASQLEEAQFQQGRSEREATALRDGVRSMKDMWGREVKGLKEEMRGMVERGKKEREEARLKHMSLVKLVQAQSADRSAIATLQQSTLTADNNLTLLLLPRVEEFMKEFKGHQKGDEEAYATARELKDELARLKRLMRRGSAGLELEGSPSPEKAR